MRDHREGGLSSLGRKAFDFLKKFASRDTGKSLGRKV